MLRHLSMHKQQSISRHTTDAFTRKKWVSLAWSPSRRPFYSTTRCCQVTRSTTSTPPTPFPTPSTSTPLHASPSVSTSIPSSSSSQHHMLHRSLSSSSILVRIFNRIVPPQTQEAPKTQQGVSLALQNATLARALAGNICICSLKLWAYLATMSSAMFAEFVHTAVDCMNQLLLFVGAREAVKEPDQLHPMGYGRAAFFWSLTSALGLFWMGSLSTLYHGITTLLDPPAVLHITWHTWAVLGLSFTIDGAVLRRALSDLRASQPPGIPFFTYLRSLKNPLVMAVILEDFAATTGVLIASAGIGLTIITGNTLFDGLASVLVGTLLGTVALTLVRMNHRFLLGYSVDKHIQQSIAAIIAQRKSISDIYSTKCEWVSPTTFAYRAEVDFDGHHFARLLEATYRSKFQNAHPDQLPDIMASYAEDVTRLVEEEVLNIEELIRHSHPEAVSIELEPSSEIGYGVYSKRKKFRKPLKTTNTQTQTSSQTQTQTTTSPMNDAVPTMDLTPKVTPFDTQHTPTAP